MSTDYRLQSISKQNGYDTFDINKTPILMNDFGYLFPGLVKRIDLNIISS